MKFELLIETTIFDVYQITDYDGNATIHLHKKQPYPCSLINDYHQRFLFEDSFKMPDDTRLNLLTGEVLSIVLLFFPSTTDPKFGMRVCVSSPRSKINMEQLL